MTSDLVQHYSTASESDRLARSAHGRLELLSDEIETAGLREVQIYGIEGPTWPALDRADPVDVPALLTAALRCARLLEQDPEIINTSAHLLAIARTAGSLLDRRTPP